MTVANEKVARYQQKLAELKAKRQGRKDYWQPKAGTTPNRIRVLPNWNGDLNGDFYRETGYHRKLGTERDKSVVCLLREGQDKCPVCGLVKELWSTKSKEDSELAKQIKVQTRVLYNMIDLDDPDKGVQVWMSGVDVLEQLLGYCANPKYGDIADPETGRNIDLFLTDGKNTKSTYNEYSVQPDPDRSPIETAEWLTQMQDLDTLVKLTKLEDVEALLYGGVVSEAEAKPETEKKAEPEKPKPKPEPKPEPKVEAPKEEPKEVPKAAPAGKTSIASMLEKLKESRKAK